MTPLMLFENVPLVTTEKLGSFIEAKPVGHYYGDLTNSRVRCIGIEPQLYLVGAHPWQSVTSCWVAGKRIDGWAPLVKTDTDGVTRQYVELTAPPVDDNAVVEVAGKGKVSSISGKLLENPDEIIEDIAKLSGRVLNFPLFREACNRRGLRVAGSVDTLQSLRAYVQEIAVSVGARWLGDNIIFYPDALGYAKPIPEPDSLTHEITEEDVAGILGVYYAWNSSTQQHSGFIELTAKGSRYSNKGVYYAKWLRLPRDAEALGRRLLAVRAGEFVKTTATVPKVVRAGEVVAIESKTYSGPMLVTSARPDDVETEITGQIILNEHPLIDVTQFSVERQATRSETIDVVIDPKTREGKITVFDSQNHPLVGIFVTLDGTETKKTDTLGRVIFIIPVGSHTLVLNGPGVDSSDPYPLFVP